MPQIIETEEILIIEKNSSADFARVVVFRTQDFAKLFLIMLL